MLIINRPLSEISEERSEESKVISALPGYSEDNDSKDIKLQLPAANDSMSMGARSHYTTKSTAGS